MVQIQKRTDNNIFVTFSGAPGDHCFALPALRARSMKDNIIMLAEWKGGLVKSLYENSGIVDQFIWFDSGQMQNWSDDHRRAHIVNELQGREIDQHITLNNNIVGKYMFHAPFDLKPQEAQEKASRVNYFHMFCDILEVPEAKGMRPRFVFSDDERAWFDEVYDQLGGGDVPIIGIQWSGSADVKTYERNEELALALADEYDDAYVLLMGSERFKSVEIAHERVDNLAGRIKWRQAVMLTYFMNLYISPDTSVMVAAQAHDTPKIMLATTTSGREYAFPETRIIQSTAKCSPCYRILDDCDIDDCCSLIDFEQIMSTADQILKE